MVQRRPGVSFGAWLLVACSGCATRYESGWSPAAIPGVASLTAEWVELTSRGFEAAIVIRNESSSDQVIELQDIIASRGGEVAHVRYAHFGIGERKIDLLPGQAKVLKFVCDCRRKVQGREVRVVVRRIHDNPSRDRRTPGALVGENLEWRAELPSDEPGIAATESGGQ